MSPDKLEWSQTNSIQKAVQTADLFVLNNTQSEQISLSCRYTFQLKWAALAVFHLDGTLEHITTVANLIPMGAKRSNKQNNAS